MRKGWEYKKLGEVLETTSGGTPSKSHKEYYEGGTIPWLRSGEVSKGDIYDAELYITEEGLKKSSAKLFPIDTVLIAMYGATVGQVGILKSTMCTNQAICGILPNKDFHPNFLKYVLLANKKNYLKQAIGGAQPNISQQVIKSTYIPVIKFSEQESVVSELDKINELIRLKKEQLKDFDNLAQSLFYEMFGDPVENEKGWEVKKLGDVCIYPNKRIQVTELNPQDYVGVENLQKNRAGIVFSDKIPNTDSAIAFSPNDILIGNIRPYLKKIWLADKNGGASGDVVIIRICTKDLQPMYLYKVLASDQFFEYDNTYTKGAKMPRGDRKAIAKFMVPLPPLPLQRLFAQRIEQIEREKSEVQKSIQDLETLLASRMQYWFE